MRGRAEEPKKQPGGHAPAGAMRLLAHFPAATASNIAQQTNTLSSKLTYNRETDITDKQRQTDIDKNTRSSTTDETRKTICVFTKKTTGMIFLYLDIYIYIYRHIYIYIYRDRPGAGAQPGQGEQEGGLPRTEDDPKLGEQHNARHGDVVETLFFLNYYRILLQ